MFPGKKLGGGNEADLDGKSEKKKVKALKVLSAKEAQNLCKYNLTNLTHLTPIFLLRFNCIFKGIQ